MGQFCNDRCCRYYLKGSRGDTQWQFTLHADGPNGALICRVSSAYTGPPMTSDLFPGPILVNITSERRPIHIERRRGTPEGTQWFRGPDNREYHWRTRMHLWRNEMQVRTMLRNGTCANHHGLARSSSVWTQKGKSWLLIVLPQSPYLKMASCIFIRYGTACILSHHAVHSPIRMIVGPVHDRPPCCYEPCNTDTEPLGWNSMKD